MRSPAPLFLALALSAAACRTPAPVEVPARTDGDAVERPSWSLVTAAGNWRVDVATRSGPVPLNEPFELEVTLVPASMEAEQGVATDEAPSDITLSVDARMPAHRHGMNREPRVEPLGGGRFLARGLLLHMAGEWLLTFDISRAGLTERAEFGLVLE